jgi:hypothetical protein
LKPYPVLGDFENETSEMENHLNADFFLDNLTTFNISKH